MIIPVSKKVKIPIKPCSIRVKTYKIKEIKNFKNESLYIVSKWEKKSFKLNQYKDFLIKINKSNFYQGKATYLHYNLVYRDILKRDINKKVSFWFDDTENIIFCIGYQKARKIKDILNKRRDKKWIR